MKTNRTIVQSSVFVFFSSYLNNIVFALNDDKDFLLTLAEKNALDEFKSQVWDGLSEQFMKSDLYLTRWIRKTNLDVQRAKSLLQQTISWRKTKNMTNILSESWSDLTEDYHLALDGQDKKGRPILFINLGDWDLRAAVFQGKLKRLDRYLLSSTERQEQNLLKVQQEGRKVTRAIIVVDANGFNLRMHGCPRCVAFLTNWFLDAETHYPYLTDEVLIINLPSFGSITLNTLRAVMTNDLLVQLKAFDTNKEVWSNYLDEKIDKDQRTVRYGGTKVK